LNLDALKQDIERTGFPLELRVGALFAARGYYTAHSRYYLDADEGKGREIDIVALRNSESTESATPPSYIRLKFVVECKKSTAYPWVVFSSPRGTYDYRVDGLSQIGLTSLYGLLAHVQTIHPCDSLPRVGRSYYEAFKKNSDDTSALFRALTAVVKATVGT